MRRFQNLLLKLTKIDGRFVVLIITSIIFYEILQNKPNYFLLHIALFSLFLLYFLMVQKSKLHLKEKKIAGSVIELSKYIMKVESREELFNEILKEVVSSISNAEKGSIITSPDQQSINFEAVYGFDLESVRRFDIKLSDTILYKQTNGKLNETILVEDIMSFNKDGVSKRAINEMENAGIDDIKSTISTPILLDDMFIGMINVDSLTAHGFSKQDITLVERYSQEVSKIVGLYLMFEKTLISAKFDHLTNSMSRANFMEVIEEVINSKQAFNLCYYDLDSLKKMNDLYGHDGGDQYIKRFVDLVQKQLRGEEMIARLGGDEFVVVTFRDNIEMEKFHSLCEKQFKDNPLILDKDEVVVQYSCGSSRYPEDSTRIIDLINIADERMYVQKRSK